MAAAGVAGITEYEWALVFDSKEEIAQRALLEARQRAAASRVSIEYYLMVGCRQVADGGAAQAAEVAALRTEVAAFVARVTTIQDVMKGRIIGGEADIWLHPDEHRAYMEFLLQTDTRDEPGLKRLFHDVFRFTKGEFPSVETSDLLVVVLEYNRDRARYVSILDMLWARFEQTGNKRYDLQIAERQLRSQLVTLKHRYSSLYTTWLRKQ